jgi:4-amino-4-deoxy-L-arabinose transferase-like glycosyltransferase
MSLKSLDARVLAVFERIIVALCDPARRNRTALIAALVYAAIWTLYAIVAKSSQGINADLGEMVVWARNLAWGYPKHPPLPAWILAGWFAIFPLADWAYYILAGLNLGIGLYLSFLLAGLWLDGAKQAAAPFLLALIPFYNFIGLKFDQNSILIPLWALTTWAFVLSYERRDAGYAALAGVAAAAAMLTKYWSVFLLFALCVAVLCDRRRSDYFRSAAPYVTVAVGGVLIAPHIIWLVQENYPPLIWVVTRRTAESAFVWWRNLPVYWFGTFAYSLVALGTFVVLTRPSLAAWRDIFFPRDERRRMAAIIYWIPILFPIAFAAFSRTTLVSLWNTPSLGLLPVVLLSSSLVQLTRTAAARIAGFATVVSLASLVASPFVSAGKLIGGVENHALFIGALVAQIETQWKATTNRPLEIVAGSFTLTSSIAFTLRDKPSTYADFSSYLSPWVDAAALMNKGIAAVCPVRDMVCMLNLENLVSRRPPVRRVEVELTPRWLGLSGAPDRFVIAIMPPH